MLLFLYTNIRNVVMPNFIIFIFPFGRQRSLEETKLHLEDHPTWVCGKGKVWESTTVGYHPRSYSTCREARILFFQTSFSPNIDLYIIDLPIIKRSSRFFLNNSLIYSFELQGQFTSCLLYFFLIACTASWCLTSSTADSSSSISPWIFS